MQFPCSFLYNNKLLTMQYPLDELDYAIDYYLSLDKNRWFSENVIYNDLQRLDICPELHKPEKRAINKRIFKSTCRSIQNKFNNIVTYTSNKNVIYLKFDTTLETSADEEENDDEFEIAFELAKQTDNPFVVIGDSTVIHEICRMNDLELLTEIITKKKIINTHTKNERGESLVELIDLKHSDAKKMLMILDEQGFIHAFYVQSKFDQMKSTENRLEQELAESSDRAKTCLWTTLVMTTLFGLALMFAFSCLMRETSNVGGECLQE